jgi:hypothetical protein
MVALFIEAKIVFKEDIGSDYMRTSALKETNYGPTKMLKFWMMLPIIKKLCTLTIFTVSYLLTMELTTKMEVVLTTQFSLVTMIQ